MTKRFSLLIALVFAGMFGGTTVAGEAAHDSDRGRGLVPFVVQQLQSRRGLPYPGEEGKNHTVVKAAFRDVVSDASRSTVQVLSDDKVVALGTVVGADGYVLTKASELHGAISCKLSGGAKYDAELVRVHEDTDLALLKIGAKDLSPIEWQDTTPAVGSFLATAGTDRDPVAIGVVSVAPRKIPAPSGVLGIAVGQGDNGPRIDQVLDGSSAARAGLKVNDIILRINDRAVKTREALIQTVGDYRPGDRVRLKVVRGQEELEISTTLGSRSPGGRREFQNRLGGDLSERRGGFDRVLQHDTVLKPRECGGPVVDLDGRAVGINIARAERVASYALPAAVVREVLDEMREYVAGREPERSEPKPHGLSVARTVKKQ